MNAHSHSSGIPADSGSPAASRRPGAAWLERAYAAHHRAVFQAARRITGSPADAEDVLQTVFTRLWRRHGEAESAGPEGLREETIGGYLHRAAVNAALDVLRRRQRGGFAPLEDADTDFVPSPLRPVDAGPEAHSQRRDLRRGLRLALTRLSPRTAEAFAMRYFEELELREIAARLDTTAPVVAVMLHRARRRLQKELTAFQGA